MSNNKIPVMDSIQELADFWDSHDVTDYEDELEEVSEAVFKHKSLLKVDLQPDEIQTVKKIAALKGLSCDELIRNWIIEKIHAQ